MCQSATGSAVSTGFTGAQSDSAGTSQCLCGVYFFFFFQAEDGIRDVAVTGVQTCALPISERGEAARAHRVAIHGGGGAQIEGALGECDAGATFAAEGLLHVSLAVAGREIGRASCRERV